MKKKQINLLEKSKRIVSSIVAASVILTSCWWGGWGWGWWGWVSSEVTQTEVIDNNSDKQEKLDIVYITEGEIDALSMHEAGMYSVCSVPNGASKGNQKLEKWSNGSDKRHQL